MTRKTKPKSSSAPQGPVWGSAQWKALHSPARFELFTLAEGAAPCSISDLARLSGRRASSLYRHIASLEKAKFLVAIERRRAGRRFEAVYALGPMATARSVGNSSDGPAQVHLHVGRMVERAFRSASRDVRVALKEGHRPLLGDPATPLSFAFEVTWLDERRRRAVYELMRRMRELVQEGRAERTGELYRIVASLSPLTRRSSAS
ncbi:MAG: winged helix-turn-helix transcriptional regulator [Phycisphaerae bacterium]|nr:winged helix-turn-helix transcriptional regulator [Phycisphaerae bacterium]